MQFLTAGKMQWVEGGGGGGGGYIQELPSSAEPDVTAPKTLVCNHRAKKLWSVSTGLYLTRQQCFLICPFNRGSLQRRDERLLCQAEALLFDHLCRVGGHFPSISVGN